MYGTGPGPNLRPLNSVVRHITDCAIRPGLFPIARCSGKTAGLRLPWLCSIFAIFDILYNIKHSVKPVLSGNWKRKPKIGFQDRLSLNAIQKNCRMLPFILSICINLPFVIKIFVLSIIKWPHMMSFTVTVKNIILSYHFTFSCD